MLTDKENICVVCTPFGTEELPELNECDYGTAWGNKNISNCIYRLVSEKKSQGILCNQLQDNYLWMENQRNELLAKNAKLEDEKHRLASGLSYLKQNLDDNNKLKEENKRLIEEYKLLELYYKSVRNQRDELIDENVALKEKLVSHKITIPAEVKIRFVDGC